MKNSMAVAAICAFVAFASPYRGFAQTPPDPTFTTVPSPPVAGRPFTINGSFLGATTTVPFAYYSEFETGGYRYIWIAGAPVYPYEQGSVSVTVPPQKPGTYIVGFVSPFFSPVPTYASFTLDVVAAPAGISVIPAVTPLGLGTALSLVGLLGAGASRRGRAQRRRAYDET